MDSGRFARMMLRLNALFSGLSGLAALLFAPLLARWLWNDAPAWSAPLIAGLGGGLLLFAGALLIVARRRHLTRPWLIVFVVSDLGWVLASIAILWTFGPVFSGQGQALIAGLAVLVALLAAGQLVGARRLDGRITGA